jgi:hypothetical protein
VACRARHILESVYSEKKVSAFHLRAFALLSPRSILGLKIRLS